MSKTYQAAVAFALLVVAKAVTDEFGISVPEGVFTTLLGLTAAAAVAALRHAVEKATPPDAE